MPPAELEAPVEPVVPAAVVAAAVVLRLVVVPVLPAAVELPTVPLDPPVVPTVAAELWVPVVPVEPCVEPLPEFEPAVLVLLVVPLLIAPELLPELAVELVSVGGVTPGGMQTPPIAVSQVEPCGSKNPHSWLKEHAGRHQPRSELSWGLQV